MPQCCVYIVASKSRTLYTGITNDLGRRMFEHKSGIFEGFSKQYHCTRLVHYEIFDGPNAAIRREKQLKGWRRGKKVALIERNNPTWTDLAENLGKPTPMYRWSQEELNRKYRFTEKASGEEKQADPSTPLRSAQDDKLK